MSRQHEMIPRSAAPAEPETWRRALREAWTSPAALLQSLGLAPAEVGMSEEAARRFPCRVPRPYAARMRHGDPADPLLRQVLPQAAELEDTPGFGPDPVGDLAALRVPGLEQKYAGRALLLPSGACAVHCRYCFRREFPYATASGGPRLAGALDALRASPGISEVILSGGDPLMGSDRELGRLVATLGAIPHLKRLRIHSRLPVVIPARITPAFVALLADSRLTPSLVLHVNHPAEVDEALAAACVRLRGAGVTLLNQSVLLRGVNDAVEILAALSERLYEAGVLPYYLHLLDRVQGAAHFEVVEATAQELYASLQARLPGYLVPRLVREDAGAPAKTLIR